MKKINILLTVLILILTPGIMISQTYDLKFIEELNDGSNFNVRVQIKASSDFKLAASNITFNFNTAGLSSPTLLTSYNFDGVYNDPGLRIYDAMTVTEPIAGVASINIFYTQSTDAFAATVGTAWMDVVSIGFTTTNSSLTSNLSFRSATPAYTNVWSISGTDLTLLTAGTWFTLDNPLPVELTSFTAEANGNKVDLSWKTATEINNYGFDVERKVTNGDWLKIGFVEGAGNSSSPKSYKFTDNKPVGGSKFLYRLKQIDTDGKFEYSDVVEVLLVPDEPFLSQNFPNPFNPTTTIEFSLSQTSHVTLEVFNTLGERVGVLASEELSAGTYNYKWDASNLTSGIYFYILQVGDFIQTRKMILLK